jgi:hypothetical protein
VSKAPSSEWWSLGSIDIHGDWLVVHAPLMHWWNCIGVSSVETLGIPFDCYWKRGLLAGCSPCCLGHGIVD